MCTLYEYRLGLNVYGFEQSLVKCLALRLQINGFDFCFDDNQAEELPFVDV